MDKIVMFDKGSGSQALVQMANVHTAMSAHEAADMQVLYRTRDEGTDCILHTAYCIRNSNGHALHLGG